MSRTAAHRTEGSPADREPAAPADREPSAPGDREPIALRTPTTRPVLLIAVVVGLAVGLAVVLVAFGWPASRSRPHDLAHAVAGPAAAGRPLRA